MTDDTDHHLCPVSPSLLPICPFPSSFQPYSSSFSLLHIMSWNRHTSKFHPPSQVPPPISSAGSALSHIQFHSQWDPSIILRHPSPLLSYLHFLCRGVRDGVSKNGQNPTFLRTPHRTSLRTALLVLIIKKSSKSFYSVSGKRCHLIFDYNCRIS